MSRLRSSMGPNHRQYPSFSSKPVQWELWQLGISRRNQDRSKGGSRVKITAKFLKQKYTSSIGQTIYLRVLVEFRLTMENAGAIMWSCPVPYVSNAKVRGSLFAVFKDGDGSVSYADMEFCADHGKPLAASAKIREKDVQCRFGDLPAGHEFLVIVEAMKWIQMGRLRLRLISCVTEVGFSTWTLNRKSLQNRPCPFYYTE